MQTTLFPIFVAAFWLVRNVHGECRYSVKEKNKGMIACSETTMEEYLTSVYKSLPEIQDTLKNNTNATFSIDISNSNLPEIGEWLSIPWENVDSYSTKVLNVAIVNSSLETFTDSSITNFNLERLDLSRNNIKNYTFLKTFANLRYLNLGFSNLEDFNVINENINPLITNYIYVDLGNSKLKTATISLCCQLQWVDLSNNDIETVSMYTTVANLNLLGNCNLKDIFFSNWDKHITNLTISTIDTDLLNSIKYQIRKGLSIKQISIGTLATKDFKLLDVFPHINYPNENYILDLSSVKISDISEAYFDSYKLLILNLSDNNISSLKNSVFINAEFSILDLSSSNVETIDDTVFKNLTVKMLSLSKNKLKSLENIFSNLRNISELDLSFNPIQVLSDQTFENCPYLKLVNLSNSYVSNIGENTFSHLQYLRRLELSFSGTYDSKNIRNIFISELAIGNTNITELTSSHLEGFYNLKKLSFPNSIISSVSNTALQSVVNIKYLEFFNPNITNLNIYQNLYSLINLDLSNKYLVRIKAGSFKGLNNLKSLNLSGNGLAEIDLNLFEDLGELEVLSLAYNQFSTLPVGLFRNLRKLRQLYLNNNYQLRFQLGTFTNLKNLMVLDMSRMNLGNNPVFPMWQDLEKLEYLNLENSGLYGEALVLEDFSLLANRLSLKRIDINNNPWPYCSVLSKVLNVFKNNSIDFTPANPLYFGNNIMGVGCNSYY